MYAYMYVCMHIHICMHICVYAYMYVCLMTQTIFAVTWHVASPPFDGFNQFLWAALAALTTSLWSNLQSLMDRFYIYIIYLMTFSKSHNGDDEHHLVVYSLQDESFVEISEPSVCTMCEQDDSLVKTKVQRRKKLWVMTSDDVSQSPP